MKKWTLGIACLLVIGVIAQTSAAGSNGGEKVLEFKTMFGVDGQFRGAPNAIRGVPGAGASWRLDDVDGKLRRDGDLKIDVEGLVLVSNGQNPSPTFRAMATTSGGTRISARRAWAGSARSPGAVVATLATNPDSNQFRVRPSRARPVPTR